MLRRTTKKASLVSLPDLLSERQGPPNGKEYLKLQDLVEIANIGKTPGRAHYSPDGLFLVKVGNLTGHGINWIARDRNFISGAAEQKRLQIVRYMLKRGDILLTSSAHSPIYIAKKIDIVSDIPQWVGGVASFVGELMMLRTRSSVDPYVLLAFLRLPSSQETIRSMIRGQTAHLHVQDLLTMDIPKSITQPPVRLRSLAVCIEREAQLFKELNELAFEQSGSFSDVEKALNC